LDDRWEDGCRLGFYVEYFPIGRRPDPALCLTAAQRVRFRSRLQELRQRSRMFLVQFPGDEEREGGCLAAGRGLIHINAQGFVEPCPAVHWAADNLAEKSFLDCLRSPFMTQMRRRAPAPGRRQLIPIPDQHGGLHACALLGACNPLCQGQSHPHPTTLPTSGTNSGAA
jgi:MoaA/NifB/PqqE/SkfB family radical SAM enzyme